MNTQEKIDLYKQSLRAWKRWKDAHAGYEGGNEPQPSQFHLTSPAEVWAAKTVRREVVGE